ncbi:MAG: VOC family protein [Bradyrhizobiaceae bacterium]|nr:VOC family protein [Bradyrhizobiaceae bacterium]
MPRVVGIDHLVLSVSDFDRSREFYDKLLKFLGFRILDEYADYIGWTNGRTRLWIARADAEGRRRKHRKGDVGFHHYAFELRSRRDVDALQTFLKQNEIEVVDPAAERYPDYYAVYFLDPDGMKLEGMKYGPVPRRRKSAPRRKPSRKRRKSG